MLTTVPQQDAGDLDQPQVVGGLLLVTYQDGAALRQPAQRALHYPSSSWITLLSLRVLLLFCDTSDMRLVVVALHHLPSGLFIVALIQAQTLRSLLGGFGTLHHHGLERGFEQLEVRYVRSGYHRRQRSSVGLHEKGALHPIFPSISGIGAYLVPPKRALPIAPSAACHSKLTPPSSSHSAIICAQMRSSTPSSTHRWNVLCTEESSGNSPLGSRFHWTPLLILKMIASRAARWSTRGRPVFFGGSCSWRIGSMISHNSSGTRQMVGRGFCWGGFSDIAGPLSVGITSDDSRS